MRAHHTKNEGDPGILHAQLDLARKGYGILTAPFKTCWADRNGVHTQRIDKTAVDLYCIYCPDTDRCYYVDPRRRKRVKWAHDYLEIPSSVPGVQPGLLDET